VALVKHPSACAAGFTGSRTAGRALFDAAASRPEPIPVFAEMSSLNPLIVLPGAIAERGPQIVDGLRTSVTMGVGQFCTKPGLVFGLAGPAFEKFVTDFGQAMSKVTPGTMLHAGILDSYDRGLDAVAMTPGVTAVGESADEADEKRTQGEAAAFVTDAETFLRNPALHEEVFGPCTLVISARSVTELEALVNSLEGQLTAAIHATSDELAAAGDLVALLERKVGRLVFNGFPTGVEVCPSMHHGGPYPATSDVRFTSVGTAAILRWARPICYQAWPAAALPAELRDENPLGMMRLVNGALTRDAVA
ncbi:MAG: aldehyde dehydrogenase family protein, partial [Chthoniobacteraceae bacterium]